MSANASFEVLLHSPRWGIDTTYKINLGTTEMKIDSGTKTARCSSIEGGDPRWSRDMDRDGNPLENIMETDKIFPPRVFVHALEAGWAAWRNGELDDEQVQQEVQDLFRWVNEIWKSKPKSDFWSRIF